MTTEIIISNLGGLVSGNVNYSKTSNAFLTNGYTSAANNTYFNAIRFADGIVIKEDVGQGYFHTFLNGIRIYSLKEKILLADRTYHNNLYSRDKVYHESKRMLIELVLCAAKNAGHSIDSHEVSIAIDKVIKQAFNGDQLEIAQIQIQKGISNETS